MPEDVIVSLDQLTTSRLTESLINSGALEEGEVASYEVSTDQHRLSASVRLKLTYRDGSRGDRPQHLFLKLVETDQGGESFGPSEVHYYMRDYKDLPDTPIPRCYSAAYSETLGRYHILMDDLSETHVGAYARIPTLEHGLALAEGLALMHAHWWGKARIEQAGERLPDAEKIRQFVAIAQPGARHIIEACADQLKAHWPQTINELYEHHPRAMLVRAQGDDSLTLIHGDTNLTNILIPQQGDRPLYIIDRQPFNWSLTVWLGVYDLAYTMVLKWDVEIRRALETPILRHYHEQLSRRGLQVYSWEQLWRDYQLSAAMGVYVATEWCRDGLNHERMPFWMMMLQRSMTAFDDLDCGSLWR